MKISHTTMIKVTLSLDHAWAIGAFTGIHAEVASDDQKIRLPIQRRPDGAVHLPATSLVGSLRSHLGSDAEKWLGSLTEPPTSSFMTKLRCLTPIISETAVKERTTTAIDGSRRAAKSGTLRTAEFVEPGATATWWLIWDHDSNNESLRKELLGHLATWVPVVGRGRANDQGWARVTGIAHTTLDRAIPAHITWWLAQRPLLMAGRADPPPNEWNDATPEKPAPVPGDLVMAKTFTVRDALHLGTDETPPSATEVHENTIRTLDRVAATTWRGLFRHRVAHIARVMGNAESEVDSLVSSLFGSGRSSGASKEAGHRGLLRFEASEVTLPEGVDADCLPCVTSVAIDRVSGGSLMNTRENPEKSAGALFKVQYLPTGSTLQLRVFAMSKLPAGSEQLLEAVVKDLHEGVVGIGGMTSRGYGTIALTNESGVAA